jgi:hypothetical protein
MNDADDLAELIRQTAAFARAKIARNQAAQLRRLDSEFAKHNAQLAALFPQFTTQTEDDDDIS